MYTFSKTIDDLAQYRMSKLLMALLTNILQEGEVAYKCSFLPQRLRVGWGIREGMGKGKHTGDRDAVDGPLDLRVGYASRLAVELPIFLLR